MTCFLYPRRLPSPNLLVVPLCAEHNQSKDLQRFSYACMAQSVLHSVSSIFSIVPKATGVLTTPVTPCCSPSSQALIAALKVMVSGLSPSRRSACYQVVDDLDTAARSAAFYHVSSFRACAIVDKTEWLIYFLPDSESLRQPQAQHNEPAWETASRKLAEASHSWHLSWPRNWAQTVFRYRRLV